MHGVRTLDTKSWLPIDSTLRNPARRRPLVPLAARSSLPVPRTAEDEEDSHRKEDTALWLLRTCTRDVGAQDVFGNITLLLPCG
jgi:hypothetical protein